MGNQVIVNFEKDVYQKFYPLVLSTCKRRLNDASSIEDAVQATFLMYIQEQKNIKTNISSWLYWASKNVCKVINKNNQKQKIIQSSLVQKEFPESQALQEKELQDQLGKILENLPKKKQEMLIMRFFDEMSYGQIALHFKSSEDAVRMKIEHTLKGLKEKLNKKDLVFSALFTQFFQKANQAEGASTVTTSSSQNFILQNTVKQQLIINGVRKMILFAKIKIALVALICLTLTITAILLADNSKEITGGSTNKIDKEKYFNGYWKFVYENETVKPEDERIQFYQGNKITEYNRVGVFEKTYVITKEEGNNLTIDNSNSINIEGQISIDKLDEMEEIDLSLYNIKELKNNTQVINSETEITDGPYTGPVLGEDTWKIAIEKDKFSYSIISSKVKGMVNDKGYLVRITEEEAKQLIVACKKPSEKDVGNKKAIIK